MCLFVFKSVSWDRKHVAAPLGLDPGLFDVQENHNVVCLAVGATKNFIGMKMVLRWREFLCLTENQDGGGPGFNGGIGWELPSCLGARQLWGSVEYAKTSPSL